MARLCRILVWAYVFLGAAAVVLSWYGMQEDPLGALWLVLFAMPWTFLLDALPDLGSKGNFVLLTACVALNAVILRALCRLIPKRAA